MPTLNDPTAYYGYLVGPQLESLDTACFVASLWYVQARGLPFPEAVVRMNWPVFRRLFSLFRADRDRTLRVANFPEATERALYLAGPFISEGLRYSCKGGDRCTWETTGKLGQDASNLAGLLNGPYFLSRARAVSFIADTGRGRAEQILRELKEAARSAVVAGGGSQSTDVLSLVEDAFRASLRETLQAVEDLPLRKAAEIGARELQGEPASSETQHGEKDLLLRSKALCDLVRAAVRSEHLYAPVDLSSSEGLSRLCHSYLERCATSDASECKHVIEQLQAVKSQVLSPQSGQLLAEELERKLKDAKDDVFRRCVVNAAAERVTDEIALALAVPQNFHWSRLLREQARASDLWENVGDRAATYPPLGIPMSLATFFARLAERYQEGSERGKDRSWQALYKALFAIQGLRHTATTEMTSALARAYGPDMERYAEMGRTGHAKSAAGTHKRLSEHARYQGALVPAHEPLKFKYPAYHALIPTSKHAQGLLTDREARAVLRGFEEDVTLARGAPTTARDSYGELLSLPKGPSTELLRPRRVRPPVPVFLPGPEWSSPSSTRDGRGGKAETQVSALPRSSGSSKTAVSLAAVHHDRNSCYCYSIIFSVCFSNGPFWSGMVRSCPDTLRELLRDAQSEIQSKKGLPTEHLASKFKAIREEVGSLDKRFSRHRGKPQDPTEFFAKLSEMTKALFVKEVVLRREEGASTTTEENDGRLVSFPMWLAGGSASMSLCMNYPAWIRKGNRTLISETSVVPLLQPPKGRAIPVCLQRSTMSDSDRLNANSVAVTENLDYPSGQARLVTLCMATKLDGSFTSRHYICAFRTPGSQNGWSVYDDLKSQLQSFDDFQALRATYSDMDKLTVFAVYESE